jgi:hypothetical protein
MKKRQIVASLNNIANELDDTGLHIEANRLTQLMVKLSQAEMPESDLPEDAEAQQGGIGDFFNNISDRITGGPKYPGTPEQKARFYAKMKENLIPDEMVRQILSLANSRELTPGQKELMRRAPITLDGFTFYPISEFGEKVGFYSEVVISGKQHPKQLAHFFDDKKLLFQLSKKFEADYEYKLTATQAPQAEGGQNPYPALKQFILMQPLPKATPESVLYWLNNSALLEKGKNLCAYRTTDNRIIKSTGDIRFFDGVMILPRQVITFAKNLVRTDVMTNEKYDTKANSKENVRLFVTDPDIIQYMTNLNSIILSVKNKINQKDPSFDENFRTLVQRNIYPDRR